MEYGYSSGPITQKILAIVQTFVAIYEPVVKEIINGKCRDNQLIEEVLDGLLECTFFGKGNDLFLQLCSYYATFSPEMADYYTNERLRQQNSDDNVSTACD